MKKLVLFLSLILVVGFSFAQSPIKLPNKYVMQVWRGDTLKTTLYGDSTIISGTSSKYMINFPFYLPKMAAAGGADTLILWVNGTTGKVDTIRKSAVSGVVAHALFADSATVSAYAWTLQTKDTNGIYNGAAGQTGQCITARKDTVQGCSQDWVNIDDSLHVMGILNLDSILSIDGKRILYQDYREGVFLGWNSGIINKGTYNTGVGYYSLYSNTFGVDNTAIGRNAIKKNTTGNYNCGIGMESLYNQIGASYNTGIGNATLRTNKYGIYNTAIGFQSGEQQLGSYNIYIGSNSGYRTSDSLNYRIFINSILRSNKKQDTTRSIIYGKQNTDSTLQHLWLNANVHIGGNYVLPFTDSIAGKVLTTNGAGKVYWGNGGSGGFDTAQCHNLNMTGIDVCGSNLLINGGLEDSVNAGGANLFLLNTLNFRNYIVNGSFIELTPYLHTYMGAIDSNNVLVTLNGTVRTVGKGLNSTPTTGSLFKTGDTTIMYGIVIKDGKSTGFRVDSSGLFEVANRDKVTMELTPVDDTVKLIHSPTFLSQNIKPYGFYKTDGTNTYLNGYYNTKALSPLGGNMFGQLWANSAFTKYSTFNVYEGDGNGAMVFYSANSADTSAIDFNVFKTDGIDFIVKNHSTGHVNQRRFFVDTQGSIWGIACYMNGYANFGQGGDTAVGSYNIVGGLYGKAIGSYNLMGGYNNIDTGNYNLMSGSGGIIKSDYCGMIGFTNYIGASSDNSTSFNSSNITLNSTNSFNSGLSNYAYYTNQCFNVGGRFDTVAGSGGGPMGYIIQSGNIGGNGNKTTASNSVTLGGTGNKNNASNSVIGGIGSITEDPISGIGANFSFGIRDTVWGSGSGNLGGNDNYVLGLNSLTLGGNALKNIRDNTVMVPDLHTAGIVFNDISDSTYEINADTALKEVTHSIIQVVSHTAGSATLDTIIDGGVPNGTQITIIGTNDVKTVIIAEKTYSNIVLAGSAPITLGKYDNIVFIKYDNVWVEQSRADN